MLHFQVNIDFEALYPNNCNRFFQEWPIWSEKIMAVASEKVKGRKSKKGISRGFDINSGKIF